MNIWWLDKGSVLKIQTFWKIFSLEWKHFKEADSSFLASRGATFKTKIRTEGRHVFYITYEGIMITQDQFVFPTNTETETNWLKVCL